MKSVLLVETGVVAGNLLANVVAVSFFGQHVLYHHASLQHGLVVGMMGLTPLLVAFCSWPDRLSWPMACSLSLLGGGAVANAASLFIWQRGVPDYLRSAGSVFLHPTQIATANTADFGIIAGTTATLLLLIALPLFPQLVLRPLAEEALAKKSTELD